MQTILLRRNRNYRLLISSTALSNLGDGVSVLALPWLASLISRDPLHIAIVAFASRLPWMLIALPAGVITDRVNRQKLIIRSDLARVGLSLCLVGFAFSVAPLPLTDNPLEQSLLILLLSAIAFLLGTAEVFADNTAQTLLPSLVKPNQLEHANGQMWSIEQLMGSFAGPPLAGLLFSLAVPTPFFVEAIMFALSAWCLCMIAYPVSTMVRQPPHFWNELKTGVIWMRDHRLILTLAVMLGFLNALHILALTILVLFSQEILQLSALQHGILLTAGAAGGVAGGLIGPAITTRLGNQRSLLLALSIFPLPYLLIATTSSATVVAVALFVEMFAALVWNIVTVSYRQRLIPDQILGRVNSIYRFFGWGMMPIGAVAGGLLVSFAQDIYTREFALRTPYYCAAVGCALILIYAAVRLRFPSGGSPSGRR